MIDKRLLNFIQPILFKEYPQIIALSKCEDSIDIYVRNKKDTVNLPNLIYGVGLNHKIIDEMLNK